MLSSFGSRISESPKPFSSSCLILAIRTAHNILAFDLHIKRIEYGVGLALNHVGFHASNGTGLVSGTHAEIRIFQHDRISIAADSRTSVCSLRRHRDIRIWRRHGTSWRGCLADIELSLGHSHAGFVHDSVWRVHRNRNRHKISLYDRNDTSAEMASAGSFIDTEYFTLHTRINLCSSDLKTTVSKSPSS